MEPVTVAEAVQLALAPIFLLAGIGALLNVMTARLGRVVDRARYIEDLMEAGEDAASYARHRTELSALDRRISSVNLAIYATTAAALLVCFVVALLFIEELAAWDLGAVIAALFVATMSSLTMGLVFFMIEISVATRSLKVRTELLK